MIDQQTINNAASDPPELGLRPGVTDVTIVAGVTSTPVVVAPVMTVWDPDNTTEVSATVSIADGFSPGDVLTFQNNGASMGDIAGSYDAATGVLTLTSAGASATLAQWQQALESVGYTNGAVSPTAGDRTISFTINDGVTDSEAVTQTVHVTVDQPPELGGLSGVTNLPFVAGVAPTPVAIGPSLTVADADNPTELSATVSITGGFHRGEDVLAFHNDGATMGDITGSYNAATGVLTLSSDLAGTTEGAATLAEWQAALRSVTYTDSAASPTLGDRTISFTINDGAALFSAHYSDSDSATVTQTVHVAPDSPPQLGGASSVTDLARVQGLAAPSVVVAPHLTVADVDSSTAASATVAITGGFHFAQELLSFVSYGGITGAYDYTAGVLTLTSAGASATLADWQAVLQSVTYTEAPEVAAGDRTISFTLNDGLVNSAAVTQTIHVTVDQPPALGGLSGVTDLPIVAGAAPTPVAVGPALTVADADNTTEASATVAITAGFHAGEDVLAFANDGSTMGDVTASYDAATGVLTLTSAGGSATLAEWQAALASVTYTDGAASPTAGDRTVSFKINDGLANSAAATQTVHVTADATPASSAPELGGASGVTDLARVQGLAAPSVVVAPHLTVADADSSTAASATVAITGGFHFAQELLSFVSYGGITGAYDYTSGVLSLTSAGAGATLADWQAVLQSVTYTEAPEVAAGDRTISFTLNDGQTNSQAVTQTIHVTVDQPPALGGLSGVTDLPIVAGVAPTPVAVGPALTVADADNTTEASATVSITGGFHSGEDVLAFANDGAHMGDIASSYDAATGVLTLSSASGSATLGEWQAALASVTYTDGAASPTAGDRTVSFKINDGLANSQAVTQTVHVTTDATPASSAPELGGASGVTDLARVQGLAAPSVVVAPDLTVTDADSSTAASATVAITGGFHFAQELLSFVSYGGITGAYDFTAGVLTLTSAGASATLADWQAVLQSVTYTEAPEVAAGDRTITFTLNDGQANSQAVTQTIHVTVDQPPQLGGLSGVTDLPIVDGVAPTPVAIGPALTVADADNTTEASATVSITGGFHSGEDVLAFANDGAHMGDIAGAYDSATGMLTLTSASGSATLAEWQAALASVTYTDGASSPTLGDRTISFKINDGLANSQAVTQTVHVTTDATPDPIPPELGGLSGVTDLPIVAGVAPTPVAIAPALTVADADNTTEVSATVAITGGFHSGEDVLSFANDGSTMGDIASSYDAATGVLTLTSAGGSATLAEWQAALASVTYTDGAASPTAGDRTVSFTINDGLADSEAVTQTVHVTTDSTPDPTAPELGGLSGVTDLTAIAGVAPTPVAIGPALTVADADNTTEASATVAITGGFQAGEDVLAFANDGSTMGDVAASYDAATGVLTLTSASGSATLAEWQAALASVTYTDGAASPTAGDRTISFTINDGLANSQAATQTVHVAVDQLPELGGLSGVTNLVIVAGAAPAPVAIASALTVADADNTTEASATVSITGGFHSGEDVLAFANDGSTMGDIASSYDAATGVLTLTSAGGSATLAEWQAALQSVTYTDDAASPTVGDRTISFTINDGLANSATGIQTIHETVTRSGGGGGGGGGGNYEPPKHTYVFETMTSADAASYNAAGDQIVFSNSAAHATAIQVSFTPSATIPGTVSGVVITDLTTGHSLTFSPLIMGETEFAFADSSKLVVGTTGADATLTNLASFTGSVAMFGGFGDDVLTAGPGPAVLQGNQGDDTLVGGAGSDTLFGGQGSDFITAGQSTSSNLVNGNLGDDTLIGGAGSDTLRGGQGDDLIFGGSGADWLSGDRGANTLTGGAGSDTFHASLGNDVVTDFNATEGDRVQLDVGAVYTANQVGADVEIDLTGGGRMVLQNVQLSTLPPDWIFAA